MCATCCVLSASKCKQENHEIKDLTECQELLKHAVKKEAAKIEQTLSDVDQCCQNLLKVRADIEKCKTHGLAAIDNDLEQIMKVGKVKKDNLKNDCQKALPTVDSEISKVSL